MDELLDKHYDLFNSLVDPNTEKAFKSASVKKATINVAKSIQRVANASCVPQSSVEVFLKSKYSLYHLISYLKVLHK